MDKEFDFLPLLVEETKNIQEISKTLIGILKPKLLSAIGFIQQLANHLKDDNAEIFVAYDFKREGGNEKFKSIPIPFDLIETINEII